MNSLLPRRQIVIRESTQSIFKLFLSYLYGGPLETDKMSTDDIIELLAVADHYETTVLRGRCEECLVSRVEGSTVFPLLQVADRYSARRLRVSAITCVALCVSAITCVALRVSAITCVELRVSAITCVALCVSAITCVALRVSAITCSIAG